MSLRPQPETVPVERSAIVLCVPAAMAVTPVVPVGTVHWP